MKKTPKIIIWLALIFAAIYLLLNICIALFGKAIVVSQIEKKLKRKATLEKLNVGFPLSINIYNLDIQDLAEIDYLSLKPSILGFFAGKVVLSGVKIIRPQITLYMDEQGKLNLPQLGNQGKEPPVLLAGLNIKEGKVIFIDK